MQTRWNCIPKKSPQITPHSDSNYLSEVASHQSRLHKHGTAKTNLELCGINKKPALTRKSRYDRVDKVDVAVPCRKTSCQPKAVQKCETKTRQECVTVSLKLLDNKNSFETKCETKEYFVGQCRANRRFRLIPSFGKEQPTIYRTSIDRNAKEFFHLWLLSGEQIEAGKHSCMRVKIHPLDRKWIAIWWEPAWKLTSRDGSCVCSLSPLEGHSSQKSYSCLGLSIRRALYVLLA